MKPAYLIGGLIFVVCAAIGVYYLIPTPGHAHFLASTPGKVDVTHAIAFFVVGIVALIGARFVANSSSSKA
jgi:hypothetical protein